MFILQVIYDHVNSSVCKKYTRFYAEGVWDSGCEEVTFSSVMADMSHFPLKLPLIEINLLGSQNRIYFATTLWKLLLVMH